MLPFSYRTVAKHVYWETRRRDYKTGLIEERERERERMR